jgi:hypothetical protein
MKQLNFSSGTKIYTVNDSGEISFNPSDPEFVERLHGTFESLEKRQRDYEKKMRALTEPKKIFEFARKLDREMRDAIDGIFQSPVSAIVFPNISVYSLAEGLPIWCNFILAIIDEVDASMSGDEKLSTERIKKYTSKYHK